MDKSSYCSFKVKLVSSPTLNEPIHYEVTGNIGRIPIKILVSTLNVISYKNNKASIQVIKVDAGEPNQQHPIITSLCNYIYQDFYTFLEKIVQNDIISILEELIIDNNLKKTTSNDINSIVKELITNSDSNNYQLKEKIPLIIGG